MSEEPSWNIARLIPTSGISGADEQERRATSALLAVMSSVKEFGRVITSQFGAPNTSVEAFIEVPFVHGEKKLYPDGLIRCRRGQKSWTALVEVKTGSNQLDQIQLENYLDIARDNGFDCVLTISNEIPPVHGQHPTSVDKRKVRKVDLVHLSWTEVLTHAVVQKEHKGVADPDQSWILGELIRYLEHPRSGALNFDDMGPHWVGVRESILDGTLRSADRGVLEVASRFEALIRFACLQLGRRLGTEVTPVLSRQEQSDPQLKTSVLAQSLVSNGSMEAAIRIPQSVSPIFVVVDIRAGKVTCHMDIAAPEQGRSLTRVNWLIRQLKDAPESIRLESFAVRSRNVEAQLLKTAREAPATLIPDPLKELRMFRIASQSSLGTKRGVGRGSFIDSVLAAIYACYEDIGQNLKAWTPAAPRLREQAEVDVEPDVSPSLHSAALSSQDNE